MSVQPAKRAFKEEPENEISLREDIATLRSDLDTLVTNVRDLAGARVEQAVEKGADIADTAKAEIENARESFETKVRDNPLTAVGVAFGAGVLLAMIRSR